MFSIDAVTAGERGAGKHHRLSRAAHDLEIRVERFEIDVDDASQAIVARFDPNSLRLVAAYPAGRAQAEQLSEGEVKKIHHHIVDDVLQPGEFPELRFVSSAVEAADGGFHVTGALTLHGETRELRAEVLEQAGRWVLDSGWSKQTTFRRSASHSVIRSRILAY